MQDIISMLMQFFSDNAATGTAALAGALATGLALMLKALFALAAKLASKTATDIDDKVVSGTRESFKQKAGDL